MGNVETTPKTLKCLRVVRSVPLQAYGLQTDGRKRSSDCKLRREVALQLASYADADGGAIYPGAETLAAEIGISRRTVNYVLDDLRKLNFLKDEGFSSARYKRTRIRRLDVAAILKAGAACGAVVQDSPVDVQDSPARVQDSRVDVQDSNSSMPENRESCTQPSALPTDHLTALPTGDGWDGWIGKLPRELDGAVPSKEQRISIEQQLHQHGCEVMAAAVQRWVEVREMPIAGLRFNKWGAWLRECGPHITWAIQQREVANEKARLEPITEALVQKQMREHAAFMESEPPKPNECEIPDEMLH